VRLSFPKRRALEFVSNRVRYYERRHISGLQEAATLPLRLLGETATAVFCPNSCMELLPLAALTGLRHEIERKRKV
jgi:hypothetical protein